MAVHEHLELVREQPAPRRRKHGFGHSEAPADPQRHARNLKSDLQDSREWQAEPSHQVGGYHEGLIFRFGTDGSVDPADYGASTGVEFVSQKEPKRLGQAGHGTVGLAQASKLRRLTAMSSEKIGRFLECVKLLRFLKDESASKHVDVGPALEQQRDKLFLYVCDN